MDIAISTGFAATERVSIAQGKLHTSMTAIAVQITGSTSHLRTAFRAATRSPQCAPNEARPPGTGRPVPAALATDANIC